MMLAKVNRELKSVISADGDLPGLILWQQFTAR